MVKRAQNTFGEDMKENWIRKAQSSSDPLALNLDVRLCARAKWFFFLHARKKNIE